MLIHARTVAVIGQSSPYVVFLSTASGWPSAARAARKAVQGASGNGAIVVAPKRLEEALSRHFESSLLCEACRNHEYCTTFLQRIEEHAEEYGLLMAIVREGSIEWVAPQSVLDAADIVDIEQDRKYANIIGLSSSVSRSDKKKSILESIFAGEIQSAKQYFKGVKRRITNRVRQHAGVAAARAVDDVVTTVTGVGAARLRDAFAQRAKASHSRPTGTVIDPKIVEAAYALGLSLTDLTKESIDRAWREKAKIYHPDSGNPYASNEAMSRINHYRRILTDYISAKTT